MIVLTQDEERVDSTGVLLLELVHKGVEYIILLVQPSFDTRHTKQWEEAFVV